MIPKSGASCTCSNRDSTIPWAIQPDMIVTDASAVAATIGSDAYRHAVTPWKKDPAAAQTNRNRPTDPVRKSRSVMMLCVRYVSTNSLKPTS